MSKPTLAIRGKLRQPDGDPVKQRALDQRIPIEYIVDWFRARQNKVGIENRVLILKAETASGKSTMFPPELYKGMVMGSDNAGGPPSPGIICTQPRVLTAIENVNELLKHYSKILRLGENIGWSTQHNKLKMSKPGLLSATIGTLAQFLKILPDEDLMAKFKYILIDETHERDIQTDITIYMLKNLLMRNHQKLSCPFVVLMSATFDPDSFLRYFGVSQETNFIWCTGAAAGFTEMWDWNEGRTVNNYTISAVDIVAKIIRENPDDPPAKADILIFLPGVGEIRKTAKGLEKLNEKLAAEDKNVFSLLKVDSKAVQARNQDYVWIMYVPVGEQRVTIKGKTFTPARRVILSTVVSETGLTLDNLKYVIDAGYNREVEYNPLLGIHMLLTKPAPQSRVIQRRGRAGRKFPGVFYPLYPLWIKERLQPIQFPQILVEDISPYFINIIWEQLKAKTLAGADPLVFSTDDIDMIDPPSPDALHQCMEKLYTLGYISPWSPRFTGDITEGCRGEPEEAFGITKLGLISRLFSRLPPESSRMILGGYFWGVSPVDLITIAAYLMIDESNFLHVGDDKKASRDSAVVNWGQIYKMGLPRWARKKHGEIKNIIADQFIDGLILFNAIIYITETSPPDEIMGRIISWCSQNNLSYNACLDFIRARDDVINEMLTGGINVFADITQLRDTSPEDFMDTIGNLKHCIYDGYRNNIMVYTGEHYETPLGVKVNPKAFFGELPGSPQRVLYTKLVLKQDKTGNSYQVDAERVSILDGYTPVDMMFSR